MHFELIKEVSEEEIPVDLALNFSGQFIEYLLIFLRGAGIILVILPKVLEVSLKLRDHVRRQWLVLVKVLQDEKPL